MSEHLIKDFLVVTDMLDDRINAEHNQLNALDEELSEYEEALEKKDKIQILDAIGDCCFILNTLMVLHPDKGYHAMIDQFYERHTKELVDEVVKRVAISNMTKFDTSPTESEITQLHYGSLGVETEVQTTYGYFIVRSSIDQQDNNGKLIFRGKVLKSSTRFEDIDVKDLVSKV